MRKVDLLRFSTYVAQFCSILLLAFSISIAVTAWHIHDTPHMLFACVLAVANAAIFTFQFVIRAMLRSIP